MIPGSKGYCYKTGRIANRYPACKPDLHRLAAGDMRSVQARRQSRRIICNDDITWAEQRRVFAAPQVLQAATAVNGKKLGGLPIGMVGSGHICAPGSDTRSGNTASIVSMSSAAESSGRFNVDGSAS